MRCLAAMFAVAMTAPAAYAGDARPELVLRVESQVAGVRVRVGDIADLGAIDRRDGLLAKRLAKIPLTTVRLGSALIVLNLKDIEMAVRRAAPGALGKISVDGNAQQVRIVPAMHKISGHVVRDAAIAYLLDSCNVLAERCSASGAGASPVAISIPHGTWRLDAVMPTRWIEQAGTLEVPLRVMVDDVVVGAVRVPLDWRAMREAWVLNSAVDKGQVVRRKDLQRVRADAHDAQTDAFAYDVRSRLARATRALEAGAVIATTDSAVLAEFRKGDLVPVAYAIGHVRLLREGAAAEDGRAGSKAFVRFGADGLIAGRVRTAEKSEVEYERSVQ